MTDRNCEILYEYIQDILSDRQAQAPDPASMDACHRMLGESLQVLQKLIELLSGFSWRHGEFVAVVGKSDREVLFCSKRKAAGADLRQAGVEVCGAGAEDCDACDGCEPFRELLAGWEGEDHAEWDIHIPQQGYYHVSTTVTDWLGKEAYAHAVTDVTAEHQGTLNLQEKAYHDTVTGIKNRRFFEEYIADVMDKKTPVTLCYIDIDDLKAVNDSFGHMEGDAYLRSFVDAVNDSIRSEDVFARIGGDEFCIVFEGCYKEILERKMETALQVLRSRKSGEYDASFSFGNIQIEEPEKAASPDEIVRQADEEMYRRKRANRKSAKKTI